MIMNQTILFNLINQKKIIVKIKQKKPTIRIDDVKGLGERTEFLLGEYDHMIMNQTILII